MSKKLYEENNIHDIATAIREQNGTQDSYTVAQMGNAVRAIKTQPDLEVLNATENGNYLPSAGKDGFSSVAVNVEGEAVVQSLSITQNGTYNPPSGVDGYAPVTVNVSGGSSNYELLEYIQSDGTQAINTGIVIQTPSSLYFDFSPLSSVEFRWLAGVEIARGTSPNTYIGIVLMPETRHYRAYSGQPYSSSSQYTEYSNIVFDGTKRYKYIINAEMLSSSNSLFIFGLNRVEGTEYNLGSAKLYMASINNRYLFPARRKSDGICGLWDTVANQFLTDSLNGNPFVAGPVLLSF